MNDTAMYYQTRTIHKMDPDQTLRLLRRRDRYRRRFWRCFLFQIMYGERYDYRVNHIILAQLSWLAQYLKQLEQYLVVDNLKLVLYFTVYRFHDQLDETCLSTDDLIQAGCLGLMTAIKKFDISKKTTLSTYAHYWIKQSATCEFLEMCCTVHLPRWFLQQIQQIDKCNQDVDWSNTIELQQKFNMTKETAIAAYRWHHPNIIPLSMSYEHDDKIVNFADVLADPNAISPENYVVQKALIQDLAKFLRKKLSACNQAILVKRYGMNPRHQTFDEIGERLNISRESARQRTISSIETVKKFLDTY